MFIDEVGHAHAIQRILRRERGTVILGFTGSRKGMTDAQRATVRLLLVGATEVHHGDCVGGDAGFHELAYAMQIPIHIHPPIDPKLRANCSGYSSIAEEKTYAARNRDIVRICDLLVAAPKEDFEPQPARGQGTWSTVRHAMRLGKRVTIVWPHGGRTIY